MNDVITGKTAVVTGAAHGIGQALAVELARRGCARILLADRDGPGLEALARQLEPLGARALCHAADLATRAGRDALFDRLAEAGWEIDLLINNAGIGHWKYFQEASWEALERILDLNVRCTTHLTHRAVPGMLARKQGRILNVSSTAAFIGSPYGVTYSATKAYIAHFTETLDMELAGTGVRALCVFPGATRTPFWDAAGMSDGRYAEKVPRMTAREVAVQALDGLQHGRMRLVVGLRNKLNMLVVRFAPREWLKRVARRRFSS